MGAMSLGTERVTRTPIVWMTCALLLLISFGLGRAEAMSKEAVRAMEAASKMSFQQARTGLLDSVWKHTYIRPPSGVKLVPGGFEIWGGLLRSKDAIRLGTLVIRFRDIRGDGVGSKGRFVFLNFKGGDAIINKTGLTVAQSGLKHLWLQFDSDDAALQFASATEWFTMHLRDPVVEHLGGGELPAQQVAAWRAAGSKVALPDQALRHKVLAKYAFREEDFQKAADEYEAALAIYPTWPKGQFACAAIEGELKDYYDAIAHMKAYLELVPNAPNAEKAKEQIWIWQDKEKTSGN
jgi:tetratricopeptide (TPR) repeat protein